MTDRANKDSPTGLTAYLKAIKQIFELQTKVLTGALPHYGERGRNDAQRVSRLLEQVLPRRYSLGTGFIICSHPDLPASPQLDIVIHDELFNSPLFRELAAHIFPIESVYVTVEVKADLGLDNLRKAAAATLDRLHARGLISNPKSKAKSVRLTEEGARLARGAIREALRPGRG